MADIRNRATARNLRIASILLGLSAISVAVFCYMELQWLGFPDGHRTDLDSARAKLYPPFIALSVAFGLYFLYIAFAATSRRVGWSLAGGVAIYLLISGIAAGLDYYFSLTLDHGIGG